MVLFSDHIKLDDRLLLSSGTQAVDELIGDTNYRCKGFVPKEPWHLPTSDETKKLIISSPPEYNYNSIAIRKIPLEILNLVSTLEFNQEYTLTQHSRNYDCFNKNNVHFKSVILSYFKNLLLSGDNYEILDIYRGPKGLKITSFDPEEKIFVGLHTDNWDNLAWNKRNFARNRICINLGNEARYFLFINLTVATILAKLKSCKFAIEREPSVNFLTLFHSYPVVKIKLEPGEYYIAPTDNIIHDGSTEGKQYHDLVLTLIGYFRTSGFLLN